MPKIIIKAVLWGVVVWVILYFGILFGFGFLNGIFAGTYGSERVISVSRFVSVGAGIVVAAFVVIKELQNTGKESLESFSAEKTSPVPGPEIKKEPIEPEKHTPFLKPESIRTGSEKDVSATSPEKEVLSARPDFQKKEEEIQPIKPSYPNDFNGNEEKMYSGAEEYSNTPEDTPKSEEQTKNFS